MKQKNNFPVAPIEIVTIGVEDFIDFPNGLISGDSGTCCGIECKCGGDQSLGNRNYNGTGWLCQADPQV